MDGELISTGMTYNFGRNLINNAFSGLAEFAGFATKIIQTGSTYYVQNEDSTIVQMGSFDVTVPFAAPYRGRIINIKNFAAGSFNVVPAGGTIDGNPTGLTLSPLNCVTIQSAMFGGSDWYIINRY